MRVLFKEQANLSFAQKCSRLAHRMRDREWRRYGALLVTGKLMGVALVLAIMAAVSIVPSLLSGTAHAQTTAPAAAAFDPTTVINPLNTLWVMVAAFLVFGMQAGFTMLEAGFCRSRETVNVLVECVFDTCLCGILFYACGFAFMFGHGNGFIGWGGLNADNTITPWWFLKGAPGTYETTGVSFLAFWVFQFAFADCASTICSGTMIGRTNFWGDILYSVCVSGFIYPIIGHWAWGPDGFLYTMGSPDHFLSSLGMNFHDFAGSTVVHSIGGWIALAGGIVLGPRLGRKFKKDGGGPMLPHDLVMGVIGGFILWFGWYGFNPGSTLSAMDLEGCGRVAANTTLAACAAGMTSIFFVYMRTGKWDAGAITNGFLAGLVAITCPCYWVSPTGAVALGGIAGVIVIVAADVLEFLRIDDPIGAWPVHGVCGIWGTWSLGLFASGQFNSTGSTGPTAITEATPALTGLFYGGGITVLKAQVIGNGIIVIATFAVAMAVFGVLNIMGLLRVSKEGEIEGLDLHEHGISAYPEYVLSPSAAPSGMPAELVNAGSALHTSSVMAH